MSGEADDRTVGLQLVEPRVEELPRRAYAGERFDACGEPMQSLGHCKWLCRCCGFLRTCIDTV